MTGSTISRSALVGVFGVLIAALPVLAGEHSPDPNRLLRARLLIDVDTTPTELGPYTLYTDVEDQYLLQRFSEIAENLPKAYKARFNVDPGPADGEVVVLYNEEKPYRAFEAAEPTVAAALTDGFATRGLVVLYVGNQDDFILDMMLVHELTHLLNRRVFGLDIPTWLDEGLATELAISRLEPTTLEIELGTLNGEDLYRPEAMIYARGPGIDPISGQPIAEPAPAYRDLKGGVASLTELGVVWDLPTRPSLSEVVTMSQLEFIAPGNRGVHYAMSAFLIRYFLEAGRKHQERFVQYLQTAAAEGELPEPSPWSYMDMKEGKLENRFRVWLRNQLFANRVMYAYTEMMTQPIRTIRIGRGTYSASESRPSYGDASAVAGGGSGSRGSGASGGGTRTEAPQFSRGQIKN